MDRNLIPFEKNLQETKSVSGRSLTYVEWYHYVMRATRSWPEGYSSEIRMVKTEGKYLHMVVRAIRNDTGEYHDGVGLADVEKSKDKGFGGAAPEAYSQALRRAFAYHRIGLDMYMDPSEQRFWGLGVEQGDSDPPPTYKTDTPGSEDAPPEPREAPQDPPGPAPVTERQEEVLRVLGAILKEQAHQDPKLGADLGKWRETLRGNPTQTQAGIIIRNMRREMMERDLHDPTSEAQSKS
jgi:hypothetical protein